MSPARTRSYRWLFLVAAVYNILLGIVFTFFAGPVFEFLDVRDRLPEGGYLQLLGALLIVLGVGFILVYEGDFWRNRDLITMGALSKLAFSAVILTFWGIGELPHVAVVAFGVADALFFVLMLECWIYLRRYPRIDLELVAAHPDAFASIGRHQG